MMTALPIPFLTALLLVLLAASNHQQLKATSTGRIFALFLYVDALSMICIGFRWSHGLIGLLPFAAILSAISSSLLYLAFVSLGRRGPVIALSRDWLHLIPTVIIICAILIDSSLIEPALIATKIVYFALLIRLAKQAPSSLQLVRLNWLRNTQQALWGCVALLLLSIMVDIAIIIDFAFYEGRHAARMVSIANLIIVSLLGLASVLAGRGMGIEAAAPANTDTNTNTVAVAVAVADLKPESDNDNSSENDAQLLLKLNHLLIEQRLYADTELNLQKLARKAGIPSRNVSRAINSQTGKNVSQWVNSARVDAACELLIDKNMSVTQAMFDAGFLTKSNFNREFRRLKGCSPSQWREAQHSSD